MYDRVNLTALVPSPAAVLGRVPDPTEVRSPDRDGVTYQGHLGPLRYSLKGDVLRIRGSLARFVDETSVEPAAVGTAARRQLEDILRLDLGRARVTRLEVFADIALTHSPALYLPLLLTLPRHKRLSVEGETLKFITNRRSFQFYDKAAEQELHIPGGLLRVELAYASGGVAQDLGNITLATLAEPAFRAEVARAWHRWYSAVEKGRDIRLDGSTTCLTTFLQVRGLHAEGIANVLERIAVSRRANEISKQRASSYRQKVLRLARDGRVTEPSRRLQELDDAVCRAADAMAR